MNKFSMKGLLNKDGTRTVLASLLSIFIGMLAGGVIITVVGLTNEALGVRGAWDGVRIVLLGLFIKGRDSVGNLVFTFNPQMMGNMLFNATDGLATQVAGSIELAVARAIQPVAKSMDNFIVSVTVRAMANKISVTVVLILIFRFIKIPRFGSYFPLGILTLGCT